MRRHALVAVSRWWLQWLPGDRPAVGIATELDDIVEVPLSAEEAFVLVEARRPQRRPYLMELFEDVAPDATRVELRIADDERARAVVVSSTGSGTEGRKVPFALALAAATVTGIPLLAEMALVDDLPIHYREAEIEAFARFLDTVCAEDFRVFEAGRDH